jgi:Na+/H+-dicarboxylate symporter
MAPTKRILLGLVLGLVAGVVLGTVDPVWNDQVVAGARVIGRLWVDGLQMTIVPLVFSLLVTGVASAAGTVAGGGMAARAIGWFAVLLLFGGLLGGAVAPLLLQLSPVPASAVATLSAAHAGTVPPLPPLGEWLAGFVPVNPIASAADGAMVPIVLFALLFGLAATRIEPDARDRLTGLFSAIVDAMLVIVGWVLWVAPLGVFALALAVGAGSGIGAAGALLHYVAVVVVTLLVLIAATYAIVIVAGRITPGRFARGVASAQIVGFGTQSSLASLPAMIAGVVNGLGVSPAVRDTVLPLAVSLFRITNPAANMAVAVYVAALSGVALGPAQLVVGAGVAALVSLAAVGLPGQVSFFTTIGPVCLAMGVPIDVLPLLLAIETIPDLFRTVGNVTADMAVTRIVDARTSPRG